MHERAPSNIFVKELAEESEAISKDEKGYVHSRTRPAPRVVSLRALTDGHRLRVCVVRLRVCALRVAGVQ